MIAKAVAIVITPTAKCLKCAEMTRAMKRFGYSVGAKIEPKRQGRNRRYDCALGDRPSVIWVIGGRAAGCFHNALRARSFRQVAPVSPPQPVPRPLVPPSGTCQSAAAGARNMECMVHYLWAEPSNSSFRASPHSGLEQEQES
jgi:hypothetical protein